MGKIKQNNIDVTKVIFRKFPKRLIQGNHSECGTDCCISFDSCYEGGQVIAFFPELPGTNKPQTMLTYMHIGQHDSGEYLAHLKLATSEEYQPLFKELTAIGYQLKVIKHISHQMYLKRIKQISIYSKAEGRDRENYTDTQDREFYTCRYKDELQSTLYIARAR
jgi:hypothetical protein